MYEAVQCFPQGCAPKLSAGAQDYDIVDVQGSKCGQKIVRYVDPVSRDPDPSISYGYVTAFTYMHCQEMGVKSLSEADVRANVKLQPMCGTFSYSEIPSFYQNCLGMTGTLDCECASSACVCVHKMRADMHSSVELDIAAPTGRKYSNLLS